MVDLNVNFKVVAYTVGDTKAGTKMGKLQLKNTEDGTTLNCILWEEALNRLNPRLFRTGNLVKLTNASYSEKFNNCLITNMELLEEASLGLNENICEERFQFLLDTVDKFQDEKLKKFVKETLTSSENIDKIKISPAAKTMHHNYKGGLVQHLYECVLFAEAVYPQMHRKINKDVLLAACILHDIGKIEEYTIDKDTGKIECNEDFKKKYINHSWYGHDLCLKNGQEQVAKMIASHHGRSEWDALIDLDQKKIQLENYYYIVHHIDDLSAKFGKIHVDDLNDEEREKTE